MVTGVNNNTTNNTTQTPTQADNASSSLAGNFNTFLTLLTTQLKNQDPTSPMDSKEFTQQLVQFSQVEQSINQNKNLEKLISMFAAQTASNNINFVGKLVDVDSDTVKLATKGDVGFWSYDLPVGATNVKYTITDSTGKVIRSVTSKVDSTAQGRIQVAWDGQDSTGNQMGAGSYKLAVTATDAQGKTVDGVKVYSRGYVTSLDTIDGTQYLMVGGQQITPDKVVSVIATTSNGGGSDNSGGSDTGSGSGSDTSSGT
ncbi:flagellar hook assembly protein FlgD [Ferrovibrio xuzhouensis]|uniref:Basal-body rod modification protein FlgD n=1 Tax=Ferrovibrio xuzhouensis TaxID=1576914 RepID=A0ABV7VCD8_9PROT